MNISGKRIEDWEKGKEYTLPCGCNKRNLKAKSTKGMMHSSETLKFCPEHTRIEEIEYVIGKLNTEKESLERQLSARTDGKARSNASNMIIELH